MPVAWSLELCSIAYVWVVFWSCDLLVSERQQIVFDVIYQAIKPKARRWIAIFNTAHAGGPVPGGASRNPRIHLVPAPAHLDDAANPHAPRLSCFVVFMIAVVVGAVLRLRRLSGASWQQHL